MSDDLAYWPADTSVPIRATTVGQMLTATARAHPGRDALIVAEADGNHRLTYAELRLAAEDLGRRLTELAGLGATIALWAPNSLDWVVAMYASALAGTVLLPLNPALADPEISYLLERATPALLLTGGEFRGTNLHARATTLVTDGHPPVARLADWRNEIQVCKAAITSPRPTDPFLIQPTSGTTGRPKGAVQSHVAAVECARLGGQRLNLGDHAVWCSPLPLHHVGGSVCVALGTLSVSGTLVLPTAFEPGRVLRLLRDTKSTIFGGVPTMMLDLLGHPELPDTDLSALRVVQTGGATVAPALVRRIEETLDVKVNVAYGQSEAPWTLMTLPDDPDVVKAETLGHPLPHREMRIVRLDDHATARHGQIGELWIRSPLNMTRYAGEATLTTETLDTDGWLHTGDLCSMDADGIVRIHGRSHDVIIRGGENLYPREIEQVLNAHPAVADSAVIGKPDERWGETVAAFIRLHPGSTVTTHDLDIYARCHLATHKVPRTWRVVESLPLTASGKVKKHVLKEELSRREPVEDGTG